MLLSPRQSFVSSIFCQQIYPQLINFSQFAEQEEGEDNMSRTNAINSINWSFEPSDCIEYHANQRRRRESMSLVHRQLKPTTTMMNRLSWRRTQTCTSCNATIMKLSHDLALRLVIIIVPYVCCWLYVHIFIINQPSIWYRFLSPIDDVYICCSSFWSDALDDERRAVDWDIKKKLACRAISFYGHFALKQFSQQKRERQEKKREEKVSARRLKSLMKWFD